MDDVCDFFRTFASDMKKALPILLVAGIMMLVPACKEKKRVSDDIITTKYTPKKPQAPIAMPSDTRTSDVKWLGKDYQVKIEREAVDSLPKVKDEFGQPFIDNRIKLSIIRADGSVFFQRVFTKNSFSSYQDDYFRKNALLGNMVFAEVDNLELHFAISISLPESDDEFLPLKMAVTNLGNISISRDNDLDTVNSLADDSAAYNEP